MAQKKKFNGKRKSMGFEINTGISNLLGDLGGSDKIGSNSIKDFDPEAIRMAVGGGIVLKSTNPLSIRLNGQFIKLNGSDLYTKEYSRSLRNITVNTNVVGLSSLVELKIPTSAKATFRSGSFICLYGGVGVIYFNPKATYNGKSYDLRNIGTEGQLQDKSKPIYSPIALDIPFGISWRYYADKNKSIGLELTAHKSFTDYLDDVSTNYYDNTTIYNNQGDAAAYLADPNLSGQKRANGSQRGNPQHNDNFFTVSFSYRYTLHNDRLF